MSSVRVGLVPNEMREFNLKVIVNGADSFIMILRHIYNDVDVPTMSYLHDGASLALPRIYE